jgi:NAD binding domain of 6-phosphogluconate dehydrogenase
MRRRPALPFRRCGRNCSRSGRRPQAEAGGWREGRGFIGLGRMGSAIAARVLSGDHDLLVFNRHPREGGGPRSDGRQGCRLDRGRTKCSLNVQTTFLPLPNHFFHSAAHPALLGGKPSWRCQVKQETNRSSKPAVPLRSSILLRPWPRSIN